MNEIIQHVILPETNPRKQIKTELKRTELNLKLALNMHRIIPCVVYFESIAVQFHLAPLEAME